MARPLPSLAVGSVYSWWTVKEGQSVKRGKYAYFKCVCKCGTEAYVRSDQLKFGNSNSCGCMRSDAETLTAKFWAKAKKAESGCWEWKQCRKGEYGLTLFRGKQWRAHRLAYYLHFGEFDFALHVLHKCDNPRCVNPDHLFLGTIQDNNKDCFEKDRHTKGEMRNFKLSERDVLAIRKLHADYKVPRQELASMFLVSVSMINKVVYRTEWKHI